MVFRPAGQALGARSGSARGRRRGPGAPAWGLVVAGILASPGAAAQPEAESPPVAVPAADPVTPAEPAPEVPADPSPPAPDQAPPEGVAPVPAAPPPAALPVLRADELTVTGSTRRSAAVAPAAAGDFRLKLERLREVPRRSAEELLTLAPGLLITNYGGVGHASSVFLRGFDAGEGQDIEFMVGGVPVNEVSNPHGHGYADVNFVIPELVHELRVLEGPFDPRQGDFAVAGSVRYELGLDTRGLVAKVGYGRFATRRLVLLWGPEETSRNTYVGLDLTEGRGFGPNRAHASARAMAQHELALSGGARLALWATSYATRFDGAGVIRADDFAARRLPCAPDRDAQFFCLHDRNQGGAVSRHGLGARLSRAEGRTETEHQAYLVFRNLRLRNNFTGFITDVRTDGGEQRGDGAEQTYEAVTVGARGAYRVRTAPPARPGGPRADLELGYFFRYDAAESVQRRLRAAGGAPYRTDIDTRLRISNLGGYASGRVSPSRRLTVSGGLRLDTFVFAALDRNRPAMDRMGVRQTSEAAEAFGYALQPKVAADVLLVGTLRAQVSAGVGTRSSDAQALSDGEFAPFARVRAFESGLLWTRRVAAVALDARLIGFLTRVDRDLVFDETVGRNVLAGRSNRLGALAVLRATSDHLDLLGSATYAEAYLPPTGASWHRLTAGPRLPYIPRWVFRGDAAYRRPLGAAGGRRVEGAAALGGTYVAGRPLPFEQLSPALVTVDGALRARWAAFELAVEGQNLFDRRNREVVLNYVSNFRGPGQPASLLPQQHFAAGPPRTYMLTLTAHWDLAAPPPARGEGTVEAP
jgi:hypothetical protein